jgi:hypothetical protein
VASSGTYSDPLNVIALLCGYSPYSPLWPSATTAGQYLTELQMPFAARLGGIQATAQLAGSGAGSTVLDVLINGTSIWTTTASRPTLLALSTGSFAVVSPGARTLKRGDRLSLLVAAISTTGHARVALTVAIEQ